MHRLGQYDACFGGAKHAPSGFHHGAFLRGQWNERLSFAPGLGLTHRNGLKWSNRDPQMVEIHSKDSLTFGRCISGSNPPQHSITITLVLLQVRILRANSKHSNHRQMDHFVGCLTTMLSHPISGRSSARLSGPRKTKTICRHGNSVFRNTAILRKFCGCIAAKWITLCLSHSIFHSVWSVQLTNPLRPSRSCVHPNGALLTRPFRRENLGFRC